jgi:hypothetical protein
MVLNTGIALYSFKFLEMVGMYLSLIESVAFFTLSNISKKKSLLLLPLIHHNLTKINSETAVEDCSTFLILRAACWWNIEL